MMIICKTPIIFKKKSNRVLIKILTKETKVQVVQTNKLSCHQKIVFSCKHILLCINVQT